MCRLQFVLENETSILEYPVLEILPQSRIIKYDQIYRLIRQKFYLTQNCHLLVSRRSSTLSSLVDDLSRQQRIVETQVSLCKVSYVITDREDNTTYTKIRFFLVCNYCRTDLRYDLACNFCLQSYVSMSMSVYKFCIFAMFSSRKRIAMTH